VNGEGSLQTLAQVSIALAGFGSLLVVLRRAPESAWSEGEGVDLLIVVGGSFLVLLFSLSPLSFVHLGLSEATVWRLSSVLLGLALIPCYVLVLRRRRRLLRAGIHPTFPNVSRVLAQLPLLLVAFLFTVGAGVLGSAALGGYLLALVLLLVGSAFPLIALVTRLGVDSAEREEERSER
jgi:hypothetical protein